MSEHTPVPWERTILSDGVESEIVNQNGQVIATTSVDAPETIQEHEANAEFIVRACNAHQVLLDALKVALDNSRRRSEGRGKWTVKDQEAHDALRAALAKAEGR